MANKGNSGSVVAALLVLAGAAFLWFRTSEAPKSRPAVEPTPQATLPVPPASGARLALVIDDWGFSDRLLPRLHDFPGKLTIAVIPGLPYSAKTATLAHAFGHEVIMHLPVEPLGKMKLVPGTLMVGMGEAEVVRLCDQHAGSVPYMVGLNNHEGSKGSADAALMGAVARWLKAKNAYFLDSLTTPKSAIAEQARQAGVPYLRRRVFLDNLNEAGAIEHELYAAAQIALQTGSCIAIGHDKALTLETLARLVPELEAQGITLVPVSSLIPVAHP